MKFIFISVGFFFISIYFIYGTDTSIENSIKALRSELEAVDLRNGMETVSAHFEKYKEFYGLNFPDIKHSIGYLTLPDYRIAVNFFRPDDSAGTVTVLHGYYDHAGILKNLIQSLLNEQYSVLAFDLPGHGLSGGKRASVETFDEYADVLFTVNDLLFEYTDPPRFLIGHSTGGAIIVDCLLNNKLSDFSRIVLVSPLIRSAYWEISRFGSKIADNFVEEVPRVFRNNSSDKDFLDFIKTKDILQYRKIPLEWIDALFNWNEKIELAEETDREVLVLQGTDDTTVDWEYNIEFIKSKMPFVRIELIDKARHQMFNESADIQDRVFDTIVDYFGESFD